MKCAKLTIKFNLATMKKMILASACIPLVFACSNFSMNSDRIMHIGSTVEKVCACDEVSVSIGENEKDLLISVKDAIPSEGAAELILKTVEEELQLGSGLSTLVVRFETVSGDEDFTFDLGSVRDLSTAQAPDVLNISHLSTQH